MISLSDVSARGGSPMTPAMGLFALLLLTAPFWLEPIGLYQYLGIEIAIWILFALGFNLLFGYIGLHSFGHGAYLGIGAYAFGLFQQEVAVSLWGGLAVAILAATIAGAIVGGFVSHRRGIYFALMTIAFGQVFWFAAIKLHSITGGEDGLLGIPRPDLVLGPFEFDISKNGTLYWFVAIILLISILALWRLVNAPFGRVLQAIRQNETRARFIGYNVWLIKWLTFTVSAAFAGLAGGLFAMAQESAYPDVMSLHQSGLIVMMVLVGGGLVSFWGPVLGVLLYFIARDIIGGFTETWLLWFGLMFMIMVMVRPEGLSGLIHVVRQRFAQAPQNSITPADTPEGA
ncbi:MAG: branched-chain amino acid ABC transporter permease [Roseibium sp.]